MFIRRLVLCGHCLERELVSVTALTSLTELDISSPSCSEACADSPEYLVGLMGLGRLTKMQRLSLARTHVTPAALSCIALGMQVSHSHSTLQAAQSAARPSNSNVDPLERL